MKEYFFLFRGGDGANLQKSPEKWQQHMQQWAQWMGDLSAKGQFVSAQPLSQTGKQVAGTQKLVTDGPFIEAKEMVGGYMICKADSYEAAIAIANGCPILQFETGNVEVREVQEMQMQVQN